MYKSVCTPPYVVYILMVATYKNYNYDVYNSDYITYLCVCTKNIYIRYIGKNIHNLLLSLYMA